MHTLKERFLQLTDNRQYTALDFLPGDNLTEKVTSLILEGTKAPAQTPISDTCQVIRKLVHAVDISRTKVVVLGGGTGLSNIIGGDSKHAVWRENPFSGLKSIFPVIHSVVCVTDDGGSTGELLKDLPLIALGDLRHVLLSSIRREVLARRYRLDRSAAVDVASTLHAVFNYRFISRPQSPEMLLQDTGALMDRLPASLRAYLIDLAEQLFTDSRLMPTLDRPQCLGNLLMASAIYSELDPQLTATDLIASHHVVRTATMLGLAQLEYKVGASKHSVLPCTTTSSQLQILYDNGVLITSEYKSGHAKRGYPVDRVLIEYSRKPSLQPDVAQLITEADIIIFAPGSLYTSIIPILQVPGIAAAIRENSNALKLLVANIWVQKGETDTARDSPDRKFHVSDLIRAYQRNIPDGVRGLFTHILGLKMRDIPGSILQRYALEEKEPIFLDRGRVNDFGLTTVAARIYSERQLQERGVIQHDPDSLAAAIKTLWCMKKYGVFAEQKASSALPPPDFCFPAVYPERHLPCFRYEKIRTLVHGLSTEVISGNSSTPRSMDGEQRGRLLERLVELIWPHPDILFEHLQYFRGITLIDDEYWKRSQQWDNVCSFFDPIDQKIKIRQDQSVDLNRFEIVFLIALGQSLLGNYARRKEMVKIRHQGRKVGKMFVLTLQDPAQLASFFTLEQIATYLILCKMQSATHTADQFTRVLNAEEGFTPPGLFFGLFYAWYLDNRFAPHIEYKMSIMKNDISDLIPEQVRILSTRQSSIAFFREQVFQHRLPPFTRSEEGGTT